MKEYEFKVKQIASVEELKKIAEYEEDTDSPEFFIMFNLGRSSKRITYIPEEDMFCILNLIDGSEDEIHTVQKLAEQTRIVEAIKKGAFYQYLENDEVE